MTADIRAERTTAVNGLKRIGGTLSVRQRLRSDRQSTQPGTDRDDRIDVRGILEHPQCARWRVVGNPVLP
ncbi:hypothetical protein MRGA423_09325 [Mycobacterium tuberculosis RGTB423]|nr:hypothetical protein MRGA423_09325 [Mycobacterium tuberculosis RGTB423]